MSMVARSLSKINEMINNVFEAKSFKSNNGTINSLTEGAVVLNGTSGAIVFDSDSTKRITWNDGAGNFQLRAGHYFSGSEKYIGNNGAAAIYLNTDGTEGSCSIKIADKGNDGDPITWSNTVTINKANMNMSGGLIVGEGVNSNTLQYTRSVHLPNGTDLDDVDGITYPSGFYDLYASDSDNAPVVNWIYLEVQKHSLGGGYCKQIATQLNTLNPKQWVRTKDNGAWSEWKEIFNSGHMGAGSGLDADKLQGHGPIDFMNNLGTAVSTQSTTGYIQAGRGNGGVSLTHNDGYGNANVTFNHQAGVPEQDGNAGRITVNTDGALNSSILFQVGSGVSKDTAVGLTTILNLNETDALLFGKKVWHSGDGAASFAQNGYQKLPSGLIIQWGQQNIDGSGQDFTLPITYPNAHIIAIAQGTGDVTLGSTVNANPKDASTITIGNTDNSTSEIVQYLSIGY